jgi:hypothetical protein
VSSKLNAVIGGNRKEQPEPPERYLGETTAAITAITASFDFFDLLYDIL